MKTNTVQVLIILTIALTLIISCSKAPGQIIYSDLKPIIYINSGESLNVNLGNFGDEDGVTIFENPLHAKVSNLNRQVNAITIFYEYIPVHNFTGKDSVVLLLNRGSYGAGSGIIDTTKIIIIVRR